MYLKCFRRDMVKGEDCQIRVVKRACGYDAGLWYKTFAQRMSQPVKELIDCRSTSHVAGYDSDYDSDYDADDDDNTHRRKRVLLLILAPIGGVTGFATTNTKDFEGLGFATIWNPLTES